MFEYNIGVKKPSNKAEENLKKSKEQKESKGLKLGKAKIGCKNIKPNKIDRKKKPEAYVMQLSKIESFFKKYWRMPTITECLTIFDVTSRSSAFYIINKLSALGFIDKDKNGKLSPGRDFPTMPSVFAKSKTATPNSTKLEFSNQISIKRSDGTIRFLGSVQAGFATPVDEELMDVLHLEDYLVRDKSASYLLEVRGDSMIDAGICEGDLVVFERGAEANIGDIVVALLPDGYTIKFLQKDLKNGNGRLCLEPANSNYPVIYPTDGQIIGVVVSAIRKYK